MIVPAAGSFTLFISLVLVARSFVPSDVLFRAELAKPLWANTINSCPLRWTEMRLY